MAGTKIQLEKESRKNVFRKFAGTAIENSHNAIKQVWVALFAGGTFALIRSAEDFVDCWQKDEACQMPLAYLGTPLYVLLFLPLYVIYLVTFYRFYVGNIRTFDMRYIEIGKFVALIAEAKEKELAEKEKALKDDADKAAFKDEKAKALESIDAYYRDFFLYVDKNARLESILLIIITLVIVSLTVAVNDPGLFIATYCVLLVLDIGWIVLTRPRRPRGSLVWTFEKLVADVLLPKDENADRKTFRKMFPITVQIWWLWNNAVFALLLAATVVLIYRESIGLPVSLPYDIKTWHLYLAGSLFALLNCGFDLIPAWWFYNPRFEAGYSLVCPRPEVTAAMEVKDPLPRDGSTPPFPDDSSG